MNHICRECLTTNINNFSLGGSLKPRPVCRDCDNNRRSRLYYLNHDYELEYRRKYARLHPRTKEQQQNRYETHKKMEAERRAIRDKTTQAKARRIVNQAIRRKKINKPSSCSSCHSIVASKLLHGHHDDYATPLQVIWICSKCHGLKHRRYA